MVTKKEIISHIDKTAYDDRRYGVRNLPSPEELCERYPEHRRTITTAYKLLEMVNQINYSESSMHPNVPLKELITDAEQIHEQFITIMPPFFGLSNNPLKPIPIRFEDIPERGVFSFGKEGLGITLNSKPATWPSHLDFLRTVAHESAHYMHHAVAPNFYDKVPYYGPESDIFIRALNYSSKPLRYREFIADAAAFDFFRRTGRLSRLLEEEKSGYLKRLPACRHSLVNLALYKEFFLTDSLTELARLNNIEDVSCLELWDSESKRVTSLFGEDCLMGAWRVYHFSLPTRLFTKDEEPTLFDK